MTSPLARLVVERFAIEPRQIRPLDLVAHNQHFVAVAAGGPFHLTLHDLPDGSPEIDELEEVHRVVARLEGPTTAVTATLRTGVSGRYLEPTEFGHLTLRRHLGGRARGLNADQLVAVAREHSQALAAGVPQGARLRQGELRFSAPAEKVAAIDSAIPSRLAPWMAPADRSALSRAVDAVRHSSVIDGRVPLTPAHGDLEPSNLLVVGGEMQVIDHGCVHWDHPLYDLAHLMMSTVAAGYHCGPLDPGRTTSFLDAVRGVGARHRDPTPGDVQLRHAREADRDRPGAPPPG